MAPTITWFGHDAFVISDDQHRVYIDPWKLPTGATPATMICVTHEHHDHCSPDDIRSISSPDTRLVIPTSCQDQFPKATHIVRPGQLMTINDIPIETVPAYNPNKPFHPHGTTRVGYILTLGGQRIYHAGDTDIIPEMARLGHIDIALLPVSGTYVMTAEEAMEAIKIIKPTVTIPMHYGTIVGSIEDAKRFQRLAGSLTEVQILPQTAIA